MALIATAARVLSWLVGGHVLWLIGALLIFSVIPFTLLVIMPINKQLLARELDTKSRTTGALLEPPRRAYQESVSVTTVVHAGQTARAACESVI